MNKKLKKNQISTPDNSKKEQFWYKPVEKMNTSCDYNLYTRYVRKSKVTKLLRAVKKLFRRHCMKARDMEIITRGLPS